MKFKQLYAAIILILGLFIDIYANATSRWHYDANALATKLVTSTAIAPDGKLIAYTVTHLDADRWVTQLYLYDYAKTILLNQQHQMVSMPAFSFENNEHVLAYLQPGKSHQSIWIYNLQTHTTIKLIELPSDILAFKWSPDGKSIAVVAHNIDDTPLHTNHVIDVTQAYVNSRIYLVNIAKPTKITALTPENINILFDQDFVWAPSGKFIVYAYQLLPPTSYPYRTKLAAVNIQNKNIFYFDYGKHASVYHPIISSDGKWVAFGASVGTKKGGSLLENDANITSQVCVTNWYAHTNYCLANTPNSNPLPIAWTKNSQEVLVYDTYETYGPQLYILNLNPRINAHHVGEINGYIDPATLAFDATHALLSFAYETSSQAAEVVVANIYKFGLKPISRLQKIARNPLGIVKRIYWYSNDHAKIEGLLIMPLSYTCNKLFPVLVAIHGGPAESWFVRYLGGTWHRGTKHVPFCIAHFLAKGFVVFLPNPRGSSGYGKHFREVIFKNIGVKDYQDVMTGVDYLINKKIADPHRLAIFGWSFGGYLTSWIIAQTNRFKVAVAGAGYTDLISYFGTPEIPELLQEYFGKPYWDERTIYLQHSPIMFVKNIKTPLLLVHGTNDQRIPSSQSYELYTALKEQHKKVKLLLLPGQGHLPNDPCIILESMLAIEQWIINNINKR